MSIPVPLAVAGPHVSVPALVGSVAGLVTGLASLWTACGHGRGIDGAGVDLSRMFTVILGTV